MTGQPETIWTVQRIAEHLNVARHRVEYVIESRSIAPIGRAGIARVFSRRSVDLIANELRAINSNRTGDSDAI